MKAIVLDGPGPASSFVYREVPMPTPDAGWVLIQVKAFGLNRSELHTRLGFAGSSVKFPRVLGIEATGIVTQCPGNEFKVGQQVNYLLEAKRIMCLIDLDVRYLPFLK